MGKLEYKTAFCFLKNRNNRKREREEKKRKRERRESWSSLAK